jgi:diguanylate cyclase (GGDEF)-like protein/PAS domain S-box-containing protein
MRDLLHRLTNPVEPNDSADRDTQRSVWRYLPTVTAFEIGAVVFSFVAIMLLSVALNRVLEIGTAAVWLFLPLVLFVTLRWGLLLAIATTLLSELFVLTYLVPPLGQPLANDTRTYIRLAISAVGVVAAGLAVAQTNRRRRSSEEERRIESETLAEIGRRISSSLELREVLQTVAESAQSLAHTDGAQVGLLQSDGSIRITSVSGRRSDEPLGLVLPPGTGVAGLAVTTGLPQQAEDYKADQVIEHDPTIDRISNSEGDVSVLALPIIGASTPVGVLWVLSRVRRRFSQQEIGVLERLAAYAAIAIGNARIHSEEQETRAEVEALLSATSSLSAQAEPEAVLRTLVEHATNLLEADCALYAVVRDGRLVIPAEWIRGVWVEGEREPATRGLIRYVWDTRQVYRTNDVASDSRMTLDFPRERDLRSQLTVPLLGRDADRLGIVSANSSRRPEGFTERDERLLTAICETGSAVLARAEDIAARLEAEATAARRTQEVEALLTVADQLSGAVNPEDVLRRVVEVAAQLTNAGRIGIATNEGDHAMRRYTWLDGEWHALQTPMPLEGSVSGWVIKNRRVLRSDNLRSGPEVYPPATLGRLPDTALAVPILGNHGDVLGSLNLFDRRDGKPFTDEDQRLVEGIAHHAAVALERAGFTLQLRELADALKSTAQFNEAVVANASQGIVVYDSELRYVVFNPFMENFTGLTAAEVLGKSALDIFPHIREQGIDDLMRRALAGETVTTGDVHYHIPQTNRSGWSVSTYAPQLGSDGSVIGVIGTVNEVTERKKLEQTLTHQAFYDQLTGLPNRANFMHELERTLSRAAENRTVSVLFLDLDAFKLVNDSLGHTAGDQLLVAVGKRLQSLQPRGSMVSRFGGDEFAVLIEEAVDSGEAIELADRILVELRDPVLVNRHRLVVTTSIGIAYRDGADEPEAAMNLMREADIALYEAKAAGKSRAAVFTPGMNALATERLEIQTELREAMESNRFRLHYQPIVELSSGMIVGTEALLRWRHPERGFLEAKGFIQFLEKSDLMLPLGRWTLREACRQAQLWRDGRSEGQQSLTMSVNVSARQLDQSDFVDELAGVLAEAGLAPDRLELELTESVFMENPETCMLTLNCLKDLGVRLAVDDFGTGYSSLEYVARFSPDRVKIDQSFVQRMVHDRSAAAIVQAIMSLSQALGLGTTAEGIETKEQLEMLRGLGCQYGQGYLFARPLPRRSLATMIEAGSVPTP